MNTDRGIARSMQRVGNAAKNREQRDRSPLYTKQDLLAVLQTSQSTLRRLIEGGQFPAPLHFKPGKRVKAYWRKADVDKWLAEL